MNEVDDMASIKERAAALGVTPQAVAQATGLHPAIAMRVLNGEMGGTKSEEAFAAYLDGAEGKAPAAKPAAQTAPAPDPGTRAGQNAIAAAAAARIAAEKAEEWERILARREAYTKQAMADAAERVRLGAELRAIREASGMTIKEFAAFAGVDHNYAQRIEVGHPVGGDKQPLVDTYRALARLKKAGK